MKTTLRQVLHSPRFMIGFCIFAAILLWLLIYPLVNPGNPLEMIGLGTFFKPGTYVSLYDSLDTQRTYTLKLSDAAQKRIDLKLLPKDREDMKAWLMLFDEYDNDISVEGLEDMDIEDTDVLMDFWWKYYSQDIRIAGMTKADHNMYIRLDRKLDGLLNTEDLAVLQHDPETGEQTEKTRVSGTDYINVKDVANVRFLPLGTDNFGRDVLKQLVSATATSLQMGVIAGVIATFLGLLLGLLSGYIGGLFDDIVMFINNLFTVIPGFILLTLIAFSIGQQNRGATTVAIVIGCTSWVWTARSVRAQVISLRNRDHVNLSKLSGHSLPRIILNDILPYIASYVVMAFILQLSSAILAEASLSMLGLGPKTTEVPTLGLMMNWSRSYMAYINGSWWAYYPVIMVIALMSFSLNLMNTGLDQVFNPQLRS